MAFVFWAVEGRPGEDRAGFHGSRALLLQVLLLLLLRGNTVPDVKALAVIKWGTHKEAFTAGSM